MNITLNFTKRSDGKYEAITQQSSDFKLQIVFPDNKAGQIIVGRSLNGTDFDIIGTSNIDNSPVIQTEGVSQDDYVLLIVNYEPLSYTCKTLE